MNKSAARSATARLPNGNLYSVDKIASLKVHEDSQKPNRLANCCKLELRRDAMGAEINLSDILHLEALIDTSIKNQTESPQLMQISPSIGALRHVLLTEAAEVPLHSPKQLNSTQVCEYVDLLNLNPKLDSAFTNDDVVYYRVNQTAETTQKTC